MSWTKRVQHPSEVVKKGDSVDVVILNIDSENKRISLGLKQAEEDPWLKIGETYLVGTDLPGKVVRLMDKGVVVDLGNNIEGFVPVSQLNIGNPVDSPAEIAFEGMNLDLRVLEVDPIHRRIVLTVIAIPEDQPPRPETPPKVHPSEGEGDVDIPPDVGPESLDE
jgi:small subunit ribosomal protein S1